MDGMESVDRIPAAPADGRVNTRKASVRRLCPIGLWERSARKPADGSEHRSSFACQMPRQRDRGEHARVRTSVLLQAESADGAQNSVPCLVDIPDRCLVSLFECPDDGIDPTVADSKVLIVTGEVVSHVMSANRPTPASQRIPVVA